MTCFRTLGLVQLLARIELDFLRIVYVCRLTVGYPTCELFLADKLSFDSYSQEPECAMVFGLEDIPPLARRRTSRNNEVKS